MNQTTNNITLILLTKNESENIRKNFDWLDKVERINEIIAVDDNSTDSTVEELSKLGTSKRKIKISKHPLGSNFASQRELAISRSNNDWILWLDADETPSPNLIDFLNQHDFDPKHSYAFKRQDIFLGKALNHGENGSQHFTRLFDKNSGKFTGFVHEKWLPNNIVSVQAAQIIHQPHQNLKTFLQKINFYTDIRANELFNKGTETNLLQIVFYPISKFLYDYIVKLGFLDSTQGIIMALCMSFHSFLVRAKLWHLWSIKS